MSGCGPPQRTDRRRIDSSRLLAPGSRPSAPVLGSRLLTVSYRSQLRARSQLWLPVLRFSSQLSALAPRSHSQLPTLSTWIPALSFRSRISAPLPPPSASPSSQFRLTARVYSPETFFGRPFLIGVLRAGGPRATLMGPIAPLSAW